MILHLRVPPGFGIAVEARTRPELHSVPAIMGGSPQLEGASRSGGRGVVREANFPAQARGVQPGMTLTQARQYCPDVRLLMPDDALYAAVWERLCAILRRYTPLVEPIERGQAVLDLSGCPGARDDGTAARLAGEIRQAAWTGTGSVPWLGVATNRLVAELASRNAGDGGITIVPAGRERTFLADLPLTALPEIDTRLTLTFQILGLRTIGQLAALPRNAVRQRFGALGERLHTWSRGIDSRKVIPPAEEPAVRVHGECDEGTPEDAIAVLYRLAGECAAELQERNLAGTLITLTLSWSADGDSSATPCALPVALPLHARTSVALPLSGHPDHRGIRATAAAEQVFPIAYRIHSMLPQPGNWDGDVGRDRRSQCPAARTSRTWGGGRTGTEPQSLPPPVPSYGKRPIVFRTGSEPEHLDGASRGNDMPDEGRPFTTLTALARTPITEMAPLFERARDLLLRHWQRGQEQEPTAPARRAQAIELAVSSFEQPVQLAFAELNRLDGIGTLRGMDAARRQAFAQTEEALATRYGDTSFRRLAHLDPTNILTERRFRWERGIRCQVSGVRT